MTKILLIRHGHVEGIQPPRFRGRADLPLTARGRAEALAVARRVAGIWQPVKIYTSPLARCVVTAGAVGDACRVDVQTMGELIDIDYGTWQSHSYAEVEATDPQRFAAWFATPHLVQFPSGESLQDLVARSSNALRLALATHFDETVVLVTHDSVNRALLLQLLDQPLSAFWRLAQSPCCINEIDIVGGRNQVQRINDTAHLESDTTRA